MKIKITTNHSASSYGQPVCLINGELVDHVEGFIACCDELGWSREEAANRLNKKVSTIDAYRSKLPARARPVPAEVWNVLGQELGVLDIG